VLLLPQRDSAGAILDSVSTKRFTTPNGQPICIERDGDVFVVSTEGEPNRQVASGRESLAHAILDAVGFDVAHDELPVWSDSFGAEVLEVFDQSR
jgi:hypothetical protein